MTPLMAKLDEIEAAANEALEINDFSEASKRKVQDLCDILDPVTIVQLTAALRTAIEALNKIEQVCNCEGNPHQRHCWVMASKSREALADINALYAEGGKNESRT